MSNASAENNQAKLIELSTLEKSPLNVRKTAADCTDLIANIRANGLMQNLSVHLGKKGQYLVFAGGRRLAALKALQAEGHFTEDYAVPCQIYTEAQAQELSLAENAVRQAIHPADEFEAFAALADAGESSEAIAQRFGVKEKHVLQRLKLGRVAPELLKEYRAGKIKLETLEAFTITDDRKRQMSVYKSLSGWQKDDASHIRKTLTETMADGNSKLVKFIGLKTYEKAGGKVRKDLFGDNVYLENPELLNALVAEKLKLAESELLAEGWGWVEVKPESDWSFVSGCSRLKSAPIGAPKELTDELKKIKAEEQKIEDAIDTQDDDEQDELEALYEKARDAEERREEIEEKLETFVAFDPEQMKTAGCYVSIAHNGTLNIDKGLVKKQDAKKLAGSEGDADDEPAEKPKDALSQSLKRDLEAYRLGVAQAEIAKHPAIAFDLLVFKAAKNVLTTGYAHDGAAVSFSQNYGGTAGEDAKEFLQSQMQPIEKILPADFLDLDTEAEQFLAFQKLSTDQKHAILAYCVASTLQPKLATEGRELTAYDIALSQTGANVAEYWRPTKDSFLSRVTREQLLEIGRQFGGEAWVSYRRDYKKSTLADELHGYFAKSHLPDTTDAVRNWLPAGMAFGVAPEPKAEEAQTPAKGKKKKVA